ncbi:ROK family protein [Halalkalibaculum sp. DA384]|uniref:ROK family protein n=1 Tax=Halalkalibaculum sp. DA384 TaxID=3373606 RepID=UPI0037551E7A
MKCAIGIDVGGTKIEAALVDEKGQIHERMLIETDVPHGYAAVKKQIISLVETLINNHKGAPPVGVGIGVAGQIDKGKGLVKYAPNLNWENAPIKSDLQNKLQLPVIVLNDVRAITWGEWLYGAGKNCDHLVCIFIGTGIGGGIVSNGKMLEGASNTAGEIGHMTVDMHGLACHCGNRGCLEALAGSWALARDAAEAIQKDPESGSLILEQAGGEIQNIKAKHVIEAYHKNDERARQLVNRVADALGAGLAGLTNILNPERIIVGGGVPEHLPGLLSMVEKRVHERALKAATESLAIVPAQLHGDSGVIGAASLMIHEI